MDLQSVSLNSSEKKEVEMDILQENIDKMIKTKISPKKKNSRAAGDDIYTAAFSPKTLKTMEE